MSEKSDFVKRDKKLQARFELHENQLEEKLSEIYNIIFSDMFRFDEKLLEDNKNE